MRDDKTEQQNVSTMLTSCIMGRQMRLLFEECWGLGGRRRRTHWMIWRSSDGARQQLNESRTTTMGASGTHGCRALTENGSERRSDGKGGSDGLHDAG